MSDLKLDIKRRSDYGTFTDDSGQEVPMWPSNSVIVASQGSCSSLLPLIEALANGLESVEVAKKDAFLAASRLALSCPVDSYGDDQGFKVTIRVEQLGCRPDETTGSSKFAGVADDNGEADEVSLEGLIPIEPTPEPTPTKKPSRPKKSK